MEWSCVAAQCRLSLELHMRTPSLLTGTVFPAGTTAIISTSEAPDLTDLQALSVGVWCTVTACKGKAEGTPTQCSSCCISMEMICPRASGSLRMSRPVCCPLHCHPRLFRGKAVDPAHHLVSSSEHYSYWALRLAINSTW